MARSRLPVLYLTTQTYPLAHPLYQLATVRRSARLSASLHVCQFAQTPDTTTVISPTCLPPSRLQRYTRLSPTSQPTRRIADMIAYLLTRMSEKQFAVSANLTTHQGFCAGLQSKRGLSVHHRSPIQLLTQRIDLRTTQFTRPLYSSSPLGQLKTRDLTTRDLNNRSG